APRRPAPPARLAFYDLLTGEEIAAFEPGLSVGFEAVLTPERPYGPVACGDEPVTEVGARLALLDGDTPVADYWYRNEVIPWDVNARAARYAHFDAWVDPGADRVERREAWEFRANLFSAAAEAKAYALRATIVVRCGAREPVTLAEGALPWDLRGARLGAFKARLLRRETMTAAYNRLRPGRPAGAKLERELADLLRRRGYDARRVALLGGWSVRRDASGAPHHRTLRAQVAYRDRRRGGFWVSEVWFEQARAGGRWAAPQYRGRTGAADFPILRKNLHR
ncbi:MAG TPA: hypothetical protein VFS43_22390, partial [Polyangiaceae bacterium]|nr:hypothetical protein [Polyangiaceae bacterium]